MNVIILMAGEGSRFKDVGYPMIKPFIEVADKHILEWTTSSLPFINHYPENGTQNVALTFAIQKDHDEQFDIQARLNRIYGDSIDIIVFDQLTRGNLETAYVTLSKMIEEDSFYADEPVLFLDSDNFYNGEQFESFIELITNYSADMHFGAVCNFTPIDQSCKWCFSGMEGNKVKWLSEKDSDAIAKGGKPMVGTFYYSSGDLFMDIASYIIDKGDTSKGEFYMSQSIQKLIDFNIPVYGYTVKDVIPLGTPDDIIKARDTLIK